MKLDCTVRTLEVTIVAEREMSNDAGRCRAWYAERLSKVLVKLEDIR